MKSTITHWLAGANGSTDRACGENPPVGIVVKACAAAWNSLMSGSTPVQPNIARIANWRAVKPT